MEQYFTYILKMCICSGIFLAFYYFVLDRKVSLNFCRFYLIATVILAAVIPLLNIPVYPGEIIQARVTASVSMDELSFAFIPETKAAKPFPLCEVIYLVSTIAVLSLFVLNLLKIRRYEKRAIIVKTPEYTLIKGRSIKSPFSFFRKIFIPKDTPYDEFPHIITHEMSHIRHNHSAELILVELFKSFLWFNPFVWISKRWLLEVHEYQADRDVIANGYDIDKYQNIIFKQLFGCSPDLTSGLSHSLTKKRFIMMTNKNYGKNRLLKAAGILPLTAILMMLFSFTRQEPIITPTGGESTVMDIQDGISDFRDPPHQEIVGNKLILPQSYGLDETVKAINTEKEVDPNTVQKIVVVKKSSASPAYREESKTNVDIPESNDMGDAAAVLDKEEQDKMYITFKDGTEKTIELKGNPEHMKPLYVIDGEEKKDLSGLNPLDVASISVLKDNSATKAFGVKGKNGVVVINTKEYQEKSSAEKDETNTLSHHNDSGGTADILYSFRVGNSNTKTGEDYGIKISSAVDLKGDNKNSEPLLIVEKMPTFQGGNIKDFQQWVMLNIKYPQQAAENGIKGRVMATFVIDINGKLTDIDIVSSPDKLLSDEVIRVLKSSPDWAPGEQDNTRVDVKLTLPVEFSLDDNSSFSETVDEKKAEEPLPALEKMPLFKGGGLEKFQTWVMQRVRYPEQAAKYKITGMVRARFTVDTEGKIKNIEILESPEKSLSNEVIRILKSSPKWTPGEHENEKVNVTFTVPVHFRLR